MSKHCLQCASAINLTATDLAFYEKITPTFGGKTCPVPLPSLCSLCRLQRRMAWRNDRTFYHRTCDLSGEKFISLYPQEAPFPVYKPSEWYSDKWDPLSYGQAFDFSRPFFDHWKELMLKVPRLGIDIVNCENSDYCNYCGDDKNCYLDIAGEGNEDCYYNLFTKYSKNCVDCTFAYHSTLCYECIQCYNSYACRHAMYLEDCNDCAFCFDCKGCKNCLLSINLRNKEYCILNEQHTKEEYQRKLKELNLGSHSSLLQVSALWNTMRITKGMYRDMVNMNCEDCTGNDLKNCKNCLECFNVVNSEDCAYLYDVLDAKDCRDLNYSLYQPEMSLELISTLAMKFSGYSMASHYNSNVYYCDLTNNSKNLFGCIGLNHKEYCILNKQYSKEEYEELVPKIIEHMRKTGEWGQFFPPSICPFGYNETVAQEYLPLSSEEVEKRGWMWREEEGSGKRYLGPAVDTPDAITDVPDAICESILQCEISGKPFKIIPQELKFYRQLGIPVPRRSPLQRHLDRNALRNPRKLWSRKCSKCEKGIETTYAPERKEVVYCEKCYLKEVY
ncbi:MAG: Uncharacterized protein Greene041662_160 [Candidatus Peregrinibacteria bacterium Greene0416_62]|nr:MAG: Uncharacterized protein Greene041662_160 [Candidatus Peregrinibacteria bacterium Greene0416_62]TSD00759.1 MAG: Uncharacterized protein Greene101449_22 [Candidatus Peregrinibacteria bacterium Greene1014_49]